MIADLPRLERNLLKVAIPLVAIAVVFLLARRRKMSLRDDLGLRAPPIGEGVRWVLIYTVWMLGTNYLMNWRGLDDNPACRRLCGAAHVIHTGGDRGHLR
jgi:hypothetical protein